LAHPAFANLRGDLVDTDSGAGSESQAVGLYELSGVQNG
jgi:hypothetical protein